MLGLPSKRVSASYVKPFLCGVNWRSTRVNHNIVLLNLEPIGAGKNLTCYEIKRNFTSWTHHKVKCRRAGGSGEVLFTEKVEKSGSYVLADISQ